MEILDLKAGEKIPKDYTGIIFWDNGSKMYYEKEKLHRLDGPAIENIAGNKYWYKEGKLHRTNGPAIESFYGDKEWYVDGKSANARTLRVFVWNSIYLGKEKGRYNLKWLKFLTENGIEEFPIIPGMESYFEFRQIFNKLSLEI
jgi:hypothetical protein